MLNKKTYFYAVKKGINPGIYKSWDECKKQVNGYASAQYKKFNSIASAKEYIDNNNIAQLLEIKKPVKQIQKPNIQNIKISNKKINLSNWRTYNNEYYIFTDGSKKIDKYAYGVYFGGINTSEPNLLQTHYLYSETINLSNKTNNIAELNAIYQAFQIINDNKKHLNNKIKINIITDSKYSITVLKEYKKWAKNNWLTTSGSKVKNKELIENLVKLYEYLLDYWGTKINIMHQYAHKSSTGLNIKTKKYYLWMGNYIVDYMVQNL